MKFNSGKSENMTCVRVGHGEAGQIHAAVGERLGIRTLAVVEPDVRKHQELANQGLRVVAHLDDALGLRPDYFDICAPTSHHADILEAIGAAQPKANILIEKPICDEGELDRVLHFSRRFTGRLVVNEHYVSSTVLQAMRLEVSQRALTIDRVVVESTKHRGLDFLKGRFKDESLGVLGYEGPHLIAVAEELGQKIDFSHVVDLDMDAIDLSESVGVTDRLLRQGGAWIQYRTTGGCVVDLYTSMSGILGFPCPPVATPTMRIAHGDQRTKYRHIRLHGYAPDGAYCQIAGFLDPVPGAPRTVGGMVTFRDWRQEHPVQWMDGDTMLRHFQRAISYFQAQGENPFSVERAVADVRALGLWARKSWDLVDDSDSELGSRQRVMHRQAEALRFQGLSH